MSDGPQVPDPGDVGRPQGDWSGQPAQPPPAWGAAGTAPPPTNGKATGALVASVLGFFCGIGWIVGLILGYSARSEIRASGGAQGGDGLATAAIAVGWVGIGLMVLGIVGFFLLFAGVVVAS